PPITIAAASGSSMRDSATPVREDSREATGRYRASTDGFCITEELRPATAVVSSNSRCSTPCARRSSQPASRLRAPVRSSPAPRTMVAITLITALPEKPSNRSSGATRPVSPSNTSTDSATTSARTRSNTNRTMVRPTSPSTSIMSGVSVSAVSTSPRSQSLLLDPVVQQIPDTVAEFQAPVLEVGPGPPGRPRHVPARAGTVAQAGRRVEHVPHLFRIVVPIGGEVQAATRAQLAHQQRGEGGIHQPALVVALLVPRVREVDADLVEAGVGDLVLQHLDRVVVVDADVAGAVLRQRVEQAADAGGVHLDADEVPFRVVCRGEAQRLAVAEADLEHPRRLASERDGEVARGASVVEAVARPQRVERALLRGSEAALAQHEAAHAAAAILDRARLRRRLGAGAGERVGHRSVMPRPATPASSDQAVERRGGAGVALARDAPGAEGVAAGLHRELHRARHQHRVPGAGDR